ncbi:hypothetical protein GYH30_004576 [Glycine max]|nr:hypothetical protein GYH30_004576 [Glycine max]
MGLALVFGNDMEGYYEKLLGGESDITAPAAGAGHQVLRPLTNDYLQ